jgi:hypothetical protein
LKFPGALADPGAIAALHRPLRLMIWGRAARRSAFMDRISRQITDETPAHAGDIDRQLAWVNLAAN